MRRIAIAASLAIFSLGSIATASADTRNCRQGNQFAGGIVGAIVGGTAGGLITNNNRGRSFGRSGFSRGRGFRRNNNNGVGIAVGAIAGGLIGSRLASTNNRNCHQQQRRHTTNTPFTGTKQQRSNSGPFGGQQPYRITSTSTQTSEPRPLTAPQVDRQSSGLFQPICQFVNQTTQLPNGQRSSEQVEVCQFSENGEWIPR